MAVDLESCLRVTKATKVRDKTLYEHALQQDSTQPSPVISDMVKCETCDPDFGRHLGKDGLPHLIVMEEPSGGMAG